MNMEDCRFVPDGEYELRCTVHYRNDRECRSERIRLLEEENAKLGSIIDVVEHALSGVRLAGGDQNPMGWRDLLGAAAARVRASYRDKCAHVFEVPFHGVEVKRYDICQKCGERRPWTT